MSADRRDEHGAAGRPAAATVDSIIQLTADLVRTPSRAEVDRYEPIVGVVEGWLSARDLVSTRIHDGGRLVGLHSSIGAGRRGPRYVLNACLDTAPFGDPAAWRYGPTSGVIVDGWLHGRGSA